ncbi:GEVED domain-containing protein [Colwellia psychrerythraea]|uniref:GEVED domain-containing protein n=1 Tax=Colwellia psychrerythraea TaxID=28229 RepID=A0A099K7M5_COLPS|nr:GEVED domain-containing protein [Colwellia psychrerythraea]KGJ86381.1 hypothetical protein GAB14E_0845 [Colwellia psychrerythraea]
MKNKNDSNHLLKKLASNTSTINKKTKANSAIAVAVLLSGMTMESAMAACDISPDNRYEFIDSISLNGSAFTNGSTLKNGDILELTPGYNAYAYRENWSVWIDLNNDDDFSDNDELVFSSSSASKSTVSATLVIPSNVNADNTEMRVVIHSDDISQNSCGFDGYGDSKDFSVSVGDGTDNGGGNSDDYALNQTPRGGNSENITSVEINNDKYTTGNNDGYADFADEKTFSVSDGDLITLTPTSNWDADWAVWIDSDSNGSFDSDEKVFSATGKRGSIVEGSLNLSDIVDGTARMRIAMNGDGNADADGFKYGEIEDYSVDVGDTDAGTDDGDTDDGKYGPDVQWKHDNVHVKVYRFEFTDVDLEYPKTALEDEFSEIQDYFDEQSYGRFSVSYEIIPGVINTGTKKSTFDDHSSWDWVNYYKDTLVGLGEDLNNKEDNTIYMILAPQLTTWDDENNETIEWGPKGGPDPGAFRMYDTGKYGVNGGGMAHEMGHAMGLHHAEAIDGDGEVFGTGDMDHVVFQIGDEKYKEKIGYGNIFGMMGNNAWDFGGLNLYYKNFFAEWDIKDDVPLVTKDGTYKIYAHDQSAIEGNLGIRVAAGNGKSTYWVEYRTKDGANTDGVQINIAEYVTENDTREYYYDTSYLLDMTPGSISEFEGDPWNGYDMKDAELVIGKSYKDKWGAFTITTKRTGGTLGTAGAWIEVEVEMH